MLLSVPQLAAHFVFVGFSAKTWRVQKEWTSDFVGEEKQSSEWNVGMAIVAVWQ